MREKKKEKRETRKREERQNTLGKKKGN